MESPFFIFDIYFNGYGEVLKGYLSLLDIFNLTGISNDVSFELTTLGYIILFVAKINSWRKVKSEKDLEYGKQYMLFLDIENNTI